jgi:hypothetical protein
MERLKPPEWSIRAALADGGSLRKAAELLNERSISSPAGGRWYAPSLLKAAAPRADRDAPATPMTL